MKLFITPLDQLKLNFQQSSMQKFKFIFQNILENNRSGVKNCSPISQLK